MFASEISPAAPAELSIVEFVFTAALEAVVLDLLSEYPDSWVAYAKVSGQTTAVVMTLGSVITVVDRGARYGVFAFSSPRGAVTPLQLT
jgi:hypothetical protein